MRLQFTSIESYCCKLYFRI